MSDVVDSVSLLGMVFVQTSLMLYACSCNAFNKCKQDFDLPYRHLFISAFFFFLLFFLIRVSRFR